MIKVLIADDHQDFRRVVREFLAKIQNVFIVGEASNGAEAVDKAEILLPDVILMDITMPYQNGLEATRIIKQKLPTIRIFIVTMHDNPLYRLQAKEAKADAYILKSQLKSNLALLLNNHQEKKVNEGDKNIFTV